jgi:6,7-dimethyl-8-ribityllumazine synthase
MALKPIAYVQASWHTDITDHCKAAFLAEVTKHGYRPGDVEFFTAPGSLEIPLMAKKLAKTGRYAAVCASGLVVDGGIYRHEFVAQAVLHGIVQTSLDTEVPVLSAVLTPWRTSRPSTPGADGAGGRAGPLRVSAPISSTCATDSTSEATRPGRGPPAGEAPP